MTVATTHVRCGPYAGNGASTTFAVTFEFYAAADLVVIERVTATGVEAVKALATHYTVSGGAGSTGAVTAMVPPASGVSWTILRRTAQIQSTAFVDADALPAKALEDGFDRAVLSAQEAADQATRSLRIPDSDSVGTGTALPASQARAGRALVFDAQGNAGVSADSYVDQLAGVQASAAAAAASQVAAAQSAASASVEAEAAHAHRVAAAASQADAAASAATAQTAATAAAASAAGDASPTAGTIAQRDTGGGLSAQAFLATAAAPWVGWYNSGAVSGSRWWDTIVSGTTLQHRVRSDDGATSVSWLDVVRSGASAASVTFKAPTGISGGALNIGDRGDGFGGAVTFSTGSGPQWHLYSRQGDGAFVVYHHKSQAGVTVATESMVMRDSGVVDFDLRPTVRGVPIAGGALWGGVATGTANALTLTPSAALSAYADGVTVAFVTGASENTGAVTVAVSGLAAAPLVSVSGFALSARDLRANTAYQATYYAGSFRLAGTATSSAIPTTGLLSRIDAGDATCYSTGQTVANLVATPADGFSSASYNWVLGLTTSAGSDDPTFNGAAGGMSAAQYFSTDGGDLFSLAGSNTTWLDGLHKAGATGTLAFWVYLTGTTVLFGTADQNNRPGVFFRVTTGGSPELNFAIFNATGSATGANTSTTVPATGTWAFVAVSFAEGVSNGSFYYVNGGFAQVGGSNTFTLSYTSPSSSAAFRKAALLDYGAGPVGPAPSGTRLAQAMLWNRALTKAELDAAFAATRSRYGV
jgi:hypothetical protein